MTRKYEGKIYNAKQVNRVKKDIRPIKEKAMTQKVYKTNCNAKCQFEDD